MSNLYSYISAEEDGTTSSTTLLDTKDVRIVVAKGHIQFVHAAELATGFRTFNYDKVSTFSHFVRKSFEKHGDNVPIEIPLDIAEPYKHNREWRSIMFWECFLPNIITPALDEPFKTLFAMLEDVHDTLESDDVVESEAFRLPEIRDTTTEISIYELSKLYWASKHLKITKPLTWESDLRDLLLKALEGIDTTQKPQAFRELDFMFIWGALRNLDPRVVDAMIEKYIQAEENRTVPEFLSRQVMDGMVLKDRVDAAKALKEKKARMVRPIWAEQFANRHTPASTSLDALGIVNGDKANSTESSSVEATSTESQTYKIGSFKKDKGEAKTEATGMAPPSKGSMRGRKKGGSKRR